MREVVVEVIGDADKGVLIVDETGFLKKGHALARGCQGSIGHCNTFGEVVLEWRRMRMLLLRPDF